MPQSDFPVPAGFWRRVGAKFCDWLLIFALHLGLMILAALLDVFAPLSVAAVLGFFALLFLVQLFYFGIGQASGRRTWGYQLAGLRVETRAGGPLSLGRSLWRSLLSNVAFSLSVYGGFLNYIPTLFKPHRRAGHDFFSGTRAVERGEPRLAALWGAVALLPLFIGLWRADIFFPSPLRAYYIPSGAMEPTLRINDRLLVNLLTYRLRAPRNGEIAVFQAPRVALAGANLGDKVDFIKRVVGTPGQTVEMMKGRLLVDGVPQVEPFVKWEGGFPYDLKIVDGAVYSRDYLLESPEPWQKNGVRVSALEQTKITRAQPGKVPLNRFLVLGDHRSNSNDSHIWGFAARDSFHGPAMNTFWPDWRNLR